MMKYSIKSQNLDNSLVFYRALFDKMPERLDLDTIEFQTDQFQLEIQEGTNPSVRELTLEVEEHEDLLRISHRMRRFRALERFKQNCSEVGKAIGLIDPDGHKWRIGDPKSEVEYEKCYVTL